MIRKLKVALVHDYIKEYGGAERVLEALHEIFPEAPVYTSVYIPSFLGPHKERFQDWDIRTSFLQYIPFKQKLISPFRLLSPWVFGQFDLSGYDAVIVSATGAYFPNAIRTKKNNVIARSEERATRQSRNERGIASPLRGLAMTKIGGAVQICYGHTPPRYLYGYATARDWKKYRIFAILGEIVNHFLRMVDFGVSKNVDSYIANSQEVAGRIRKFYRREAKVIYPPVNVSALSFPRRRESRREWIPDQVRNDKLEGYYLTGGRLARAKHTDLIVRACEELDVPLKVFGRGFGSYEIKIKRPHPDPLLKGEGIKMDIVEFLGEVSDEEKMELMRGARAFIFAGEDEDFGIVPVEAMGAGVPVIAYKSGGVKETIIENKTGVFFEELSAEGLIEAIQRFEKMKISADDCRKQAEKFGKERFRREIQEYVRSKTKNQNYNLKVKSKRVNFCHPERGTSRGVSCRNTIHAAFWYEIFRLQVAIGDLPLRMTNLCNMSN